MWKPSHGSAPPGMGVCGEERNVPDVSSSPPVAFQLWEACCISACSAPGVFVTPYHSRVSISTCSTAAGDTVGIELVVVSQNAGHAPVPESGI